MRHRFSEEGLQDLGPSARGLVRHVGRGGGSAGSVLRSQGTLGPVGLSRYRARGIRMSTFLCSLRTDPAAARGALLNPLRFQKQILLNGLGLGSWLRSCLHEGSWGPATRIRILTTDPGPRQGHGLRVTLSGRNPMEGVNEHGIHAGTFIGSPVAGLSAMFVPHS